jgi:hypothetical protein
MSPDDDHIGLLGAPEVWTTQKMRMNSDSGSRSGSSGSGNCRRAVFVPYSGSTSRLNDGLKYVTMRAVLCSRIAKLPR